VILFQQYLHRCTEKVIEEINISVMEFIELKQEVFTPEMLLLGMLNHKNSGLLEIFQEAGYQPEETTNRIMDEIYYKQQLLPQKSAEVRQQIKVTPDVEELFKIALDITNEFQDKYISEDSLFLAMFRLRSGDLTEIFDNAGIDESKIIAAVKTLRKGRTITDKKAESKDDALLKLFTTDLTEMARKDLLDPVIGREQEIIRVIEVLSRRKKNNPILIGYPGVGKTVIVEGLANRIAAADVPETLLDKRILQLDMAEIVAGAKFKGEFEERMKAIKDEIINATGSIILFIDETHTVVSSSDPGGISASNILKPALAKGQLQCIGATTFQEYKKYIETDKALERRFQPITVSEPTIEETITILTGLKEKYENHHGIKYDEEALVMAAKLSEKYISDRFQPDKAIDLIDEAGARKHLQVIYVPPAIGQLEREKKKLKDEQMASYERGDFKNVALLQQKLSILTEELQKAREKMEKEREPVERKVILDDMAEVITRWTGIPAHRMLESEAEKLLHMEENLHHRVIGQDVAIHAVSDAIRRNRAGLKETDRPIGAFLFLGPSGVGKTELAKALAEFLMDDEKRIIRLDMSEYMEPHTVSRLIGSPPGYVGYGEGGQLTEAVKRDPYSVILLDEIEKAHSNLFNVLLQIFDEGHLTDTQGVRVSFKNTIIIGTSNIGGQEIAKDVKRIGFETFKEDEKTYEDMKKLIMSDVKKFFKPEFINRLDDIIVFHSLTRENFQQIVELELSKLKKRLAEESIEVEFSGKVKQMLLKFGFNETYGARPLKREIEKRIENPLSIMKMKNELKKDRKIVLDEKEGEIFVKK
jgi:ATP-dependent Clp protease ATP-binding subunit ClpC